MTTDRKPHVSVVIAVRNASTTIDAQLAGLAAQDHNLPWEVILVDNASTDDTRKRALAWCDRLPLRVVTETTAGIDTVRNRGIAEATSDRVLICDGDDVVSPSWVRDMTRALEVFDLVGGPLEYEQLNDPGVPDRGRPQETGLRATFGYLYSMGCNLGARRSVFEALGGFDGGDDVSFCVRAQAAGFSIGFAESAVVHYRLRSHPRDFLRQQYVYGRRAELVAESFAAEGITGTTSQRWKIVAVRILGLLRRFPEMVGPRSRIEYLGEVWYVAGSWVGLSARSMRRLRRPGHLRRGT